MYMLQASAMSECAQSQGLSKPDNTIDTNRTSWLSVETGSYNHIATFSMARGGWMLSLLLTATFFVFMLTPCWGQFQQINLTTPNTPCNNSSIYEGIEGPSLDCRGAINGNTGTEYITNLSWYDNPNCMYTGRREPSPYWLVNLKQPHNIHRIIVYTDLRGWKYYLRGTSVWVDESVIYTFCGNQSCIDNPHTITDNLPVTGQIIKLTQTANGFVTICELQAEGCALNMYGENCTRPCSCQCGENGGATTCDSITGICFGCQPGWWGRGCDKNCSALCDGPCERDSGDRCLSCKGHFAPPLCTECQDGYYGTITCEPCGRCSNNTVCDKKNGSCPEGCVDGYSGDLCDVVQVAAPGFVGRAIAGGVVGGVVVVVAVPVLVVFIVFRKRRSRDASSPDDPNKQRTEEQRDNAWPVVNTERNKPGTCHPELNYAYLDNYVNPDDITPYSMLQGGSRHPANINTRGGTGNVLYQKTNIPCYKTYV